MDNKKSNMTKNKIAQELVKLRWAKTTPEERKEHSRKMTLAKQKKNETRTTN